MHLPDNLINTKVASGLVSVAAVALGFAFEHVRQKVTARSAVIVQAGSNKLKQIGKGLQMVDTTYFAKLFLVVSLLLGLQAFDFSLTDGYSVHIMGGVLAFLVLDTWGGFLAIALVLIIQSVFFGDGGLQILGGNIFNMAIAGTLVMGYLFKFLIKYLSRNKVIMIISWLSIMTVALSCFLEINFFSSSANFANFSLLFKNYAQLGIIEGLLTIVLYQAYTKYYGQVEA